MPFVAKNESKDSLDRRGGELIYSQKPKNTWNVCVANSYVDTAMKINLAAGMPWRNVWVTHTEVFILYIVTRKTTRENLSNLYCDPFISLPSSVPHTE